MSDHLTDDQLSALLGGSASEGTAFIGFTDNPIICNCATGLFGHHPPDCSFWDSVDDTIETEEG